MEKESSVQLIVAPQEFFRSQLSEAAQSARIALDDHTEFYLVNVLCDFINPAKINDELKELDVMGTPVALMWKKALEASPEQQARIYKRLGDTSLYVAGYFQDYFNRKAFDINYYASVGKTAYSSLSTIMRERHQDEHFSTMYNGLSDQFEKFIELFAIISDALGHAPADLLSIYDRWNQTRSERLRRHLQDHGITPVGVTKKAQ